VRRTAINNIGNTAFELGVRYLTRGASAYVAGPVALTSTVRQPTQARPDPAPAVRRPRSHHRRPLPWRQADTVGQGAAAAARAAELAEQRARQQAMEEQARAAASATAAAERAAAAESMLRQGLNRAAAAMDAVASVRETETSFVVTLGSGAFASGAAMLGTAPRAELRVLATVLAGYPGHVITVEGHTDAVGNPDANVALSRERAAAVRAGLIVEGVDPLWTGARGFGAARPVATNDTAAGRATNRRVEVIVARRPCAAPPRTAADGSLTCP
jgi:outer membrane protein OmpA-like peptidoglycan-associated protein